MTRSALSAQRRSTIVFAPEEMRTKQAMKAECDINQIMAKYIKTGTVAHFNANGGRYMDVPAIDFHEAVETVRAAEELFGGLPAQIRKRFENDPAQFLAFVQDSSNSAEAIKLGLASARPGIDPATGEPFPAEPLPAP